MTSLEEEFDDDELSAEDSFEQVMLAGISGHARSQQRVIGPSGIGTPCPMKLAYQLAQADPARLPHTEWRQTVGTGVHSWAENAFNTWGKGRWLTETRVYVGDIVTPRTRLEIWGTSDLFHIPTGTVVDLKVPGNEGLKKMRQHGIGQTYHVQSQLYGCGYANKGFEVKRVAIAAMPAAGEFRDRVWVEHDFNPKVAQAGLDRASRVLAHIERHGLEATLAKMKPVDDYCRKCEFARPGKDRPTCPTFTPRPPAAGSLGELMARRRR